MKLRFEQNSIRLRLRKPDIAALRLNGFVQETVVFPGAALMYMLRIAETHALTASLSEIAIAIDLPAEMAAQWMNSDAVGIYQSVQVGKGQILKVTIEKDFSCKDRPHENKADTFTEMADQDGHTGAC